ncbi:MAG: hypothetical protein RB148_09450 [Armatimonadota bacterium]|nr:hypothetical protein [Armatimonadota bacterium]
MDILILAALIVLGVAVLATTDFRLVLAILFGNTPSFPNVSPSRAGDELPHDGLTMGTLYIGKQGSGKTSSLARHLVECFKRYPDRAIFVLDPSGSLKKGILSLILSEPLDVREALLKRVVYDKMGDEEWVIPLPEFSPEYGTTFEEQVQRVTGNLAKLAPHLVTNAPLLGGLAVEEIAPAICRLLTAMTNEHDECWQITEAKRLLRDEGWLKRALNGFGGKVPAAKWYLEKVLGDGVRPHERELRTYALVSLLGVVEPREIRARVGYYRPGWTPKEAIEKGLMVIVDGSALTNQRPAQHYLFAQVYSLIMAEINQREPHDPADQPVSLVMDEVYSLLKVPGMAEEVGMISPLYRSRKLQLYIVLQALWQLDEALREQVTSLGNWVVFPVAAFDEAYAVAKELFKYEPKTVKVDARTETQQPIFEPDRGQYLAQANWIQRLKHRECIIRRYHSEQEMDRYVRHVPRTNEIPTVEVPQKLLEETQEQLLRERGVRVRDALEVINQRGLEKGRTTV